MKLCNISSIGDFERGIVLKKTIVPKQNFGFGNTSEVCPLVETNLNVAEIMSKPPFHSIEIDTNTISGPLRSLRPVTLELVSQTPLESFWDMLVNQHHYLGYRKLLGHRLKYLAFLQDRPVAALSWSAPALKSRARDRYIGWSDEQRKTYLKRTANNSRFLILPWVKVPNLASHLLSLNISQLSKDWFQRFSQTLLFLETFVDPRYFKGTSYQAANWKFVGHTYGSGKQGQGYFYHGAKKEIYVYALTSKFRKIIGCEQKPYSPFHRSPLSFKKVEELKMILRHAQWNPDLVPSMSIKDEDISVMADELVKFHEQFHGCFGRIEHERLGLAYISGLISNSKAKSIEPIALEFLDKKEVRSLQRFMKTYRWDQEAMEAKHQSFLSETICSPHGMINIDSSEFLKKGKESVGVARQYCGAAGKVENCQSGVFAGYSSDKGYGLLTCRLYMPESWFSKEQKERREENMVPDDLAFQTKPQIALDLINKIVETKLFPAKWIGCDSTFGSDSHFLKSLPGELYYFASVRSDAKVFLKKPKVGLPFYKGRGRHPKKAQVLSGQEPFSVSEIAKSKRRSFKPVVLAEGAKGPIIAHVLTLRVYQSKDGLPDDTPVWLIIRRSSDGQIKYALSNAPEDIALSELHKASTMRWPIEQCFQEGKSHVGMDQYEHRSWPAWHRHMTYVFLALHFLLRLRLRFKKKSDYHVAAGSKINCDGSASSVPRQKRGYKNCGIPH